MLGADWRLSACIRQTRIGQLNDRRSLFAYYPEALDDRVYFRPRTGSGGAAGTGGRSSEPGSYDAFSLVAMVLVTLGATTLAASPALLPPMTWLWAQLPVLGAGSGPGGHHDEVAVSAAASWVASRALATRARNAWMVAVATLCKSSRSRPAPTAPKGSR